MYWSLFLPPTPLSGSGTTTFQDARLGMILASAPLGMLPELARPQHKPGAQSTAVVGLYTKKKFFYLKKCPGSASGGCRPVVDVEAGCGSTGLDV